MKLKKEEPGPITQNTPHFDLKTPMTTLLQCLYDNVSLNNFILVDVSYTPRFDNGLYTFILCDFLGDILSLQLWLPGGLFVLFF